MEETTKKKRGRKKKTETAPGFSVEAMRAAAGNYGNGKLMKHRLVMNFGKTRAAAIMKEVEVIRKIVV